jgi:hypothetical protein
MATAYAQPNETTASNVTDFNDKPGTPDADVHPYVDEGYPPGNVGDWFLCTSISRYVWLKFEDMPADFDKTGANGFGLLYYYMTAVFLLPCKITVQGFVSGIAVTEAKQWAINKTNEAAWLSFDETEITANWDGSKGYLTKAQMNDLEIRIQYGNGSGAEEDPPHYQ